MKSAGRMIDRGAELCGSKSEVARRLGVSPQTLYNWETGRRPMPDEQIDALATLIGFDPIKALGEYHHEWMRKKTAGNALAGTAAAVSFLVVALCGGSDANAGTLQPGEGLRSIHYAKFVAWMRRRTTKLLRLIQAGAAPRRSSATRRPAAAPFLP
jgi:DNA-binding XRE family transcriptional regulator